MSRWRKFTFSKSGPALADCRGDSASSILRVVLKHLTSLGEFMASRVTSFLHPGAGRFTLYF